MKTKSFIVGIIFCIWGVNHLLAQSGDAIIRQFTMKDGLPDEGITSIIQDKQGYIWLSTFSGISRFDGYHFTNYKNIPGSSNSLTNNSTRKLWENQDGKIWIGTSEGFDILDPVTGKFYHSWPDSLNVNNDFGMSVGSFRKRKDGTILIGTSNGIFLTDPVKLAIKRLSKTLKETFFDFSETSDSSIWAAYAGGLLHIDNVTHQIKRYVHDINEPKSISHIYVNTILIDKNERVWVGTNSGLDLFEPNNQVFIHYLPGIRANTILENPNGLLLIGTVKGLYEFNPETGNHRHLMDGNIKSILRDKQGIIWLGTLGDGLKQYDPKNIKFKVYSQFNDIGALAQDSSFQIWMASGNSLFTFNPVLKNFEEVLHRSADPKSFSGKPVSTLYYDGKGIVWISALNGSQEKYDLNHQAFSLTHAKPVDLIAFSKDSHDHNWFGHWDYVEYWNPKTRQRVGKLPSGQVNCLLEDAEQNMWIGTSSELIKYNLKTGKHDILKNDPFDSQSLSSNLVHHLMLDSSHTLWIGTSGGLNQLIKGTEASPKFKHWDASESGLPQNDVFSIVDGKDGTLWIACGNMISHFFPEQNVFINYDYSDGLPGKNFRGKHYLPAKGLRASNGEIYFGSSHGLIVFHPDSLKDNPYVPPVVITSFSIHNQPMSVEATDADTLEWKSPLNRNVSYTKDMVLDHFQNDFTFEFAALNYVNPESNQYKYRLEPYETEWIETSASNRVARYTNISSGKYIFRVIASNDDGVWNEEGVTLSITITPPWWRTGWAYAGYGLLFIAGVWRVHVFQKERTIRNEREKSKERELQKAKEVDHLKTSFFTNISHEFRTPLTLIKGPVQDTIEQLINKRSEIDRKKIIDRLTLVQHNSDHLLKLVNQLLDLAKLESGNMTIEKSKGDINSFINAIVSSFYSLAEQKDITIQVDLPPVHYEALFDKDKLEPILINLINNAIKFTHEGGRVSVKAEVVFLQQPVTSNQQLTLRVKDTGIGIPEDQQSKIFERFHKVSETHTEVGTGIGLALVKEIITLLGGEITVNSKPGEGSEFTVVLPLELASSHELQATSLENVNIETESTVQEQTASSQKLVAGSQKVEHQNKPHILVVEDHSDLRAFIIDCLGDEFYFLEAENGKTGLAIAIEKTPDLIISDIMMPEMDGITMTGKVKSDIHTSHIPLILLTAKSTEDSKLKGLEKGADDYLTKPFNKQELLLKVRNVIHRQMKVRERLRAELMSTVPKMEILSEDEKFLNVVKDEILKHLSDEQFSVEVLAEEIGLSRSQLYRKIIALTGLSVNELIRKLRMQKAAQLLDQKWGPIAQVAYEVGISNLSYFSKIFKEEFGVLPSEYVAVKQT